MGRWLIVSALGALWLAGCGNPEVNQPDALEIIHMPLDGAVDVEPDVAVRIYFSDAVDTGSLGADAVRLESAAWDGTACAESWTDVGWAAAVDPDQPNAIRIGTEAESLQPGTCYRVLCTTSLQGVDSGPLPALGHPDLPADTAAVAHFRTRP
jgi:hypothetical protein